MSRLDPTWINKFGFHYGKLENGLAYRGATPPLSWSIGPETRSRQKTVDLPKRYVVDFPRHRRIRAPA